MLGQDVVRVGTLANHEVVAFERLELDVTDAAAVSEAVHREGPQAVVNCAAYTNVDGAEDEPDEALRVNAEGARNIAAAAAEVGASVVHPSTDYVFDGTKPEPYLESDEPSPLSSYGRSKLAGEQATRAANPSHHVVRSSWLFGAGGRNFVETMLELGREQGQVVVVRDQVGSPTWTLHLAEGLVRLLDSRAFGLHHMAAGGECTWYDFAREIFARASVDCHVLSCTTEELGRPAPRPAYSVLRSERAEAITLPEWRVGLEGYLAERATTDPLQEPEHA
jgi:dTDP-4-dehydrorhamnose reductase